MTYQRIPKVRLPDWVRESLSSPPAMMPSEATEEMIDAYVAENELSDNLRCNQREFAQVAYRAMFKARPRGTDE